MYKRSRGSAPCGTSDLRTGRGAAAYLISEAGGWDVVPPTIIREVARSRYDAGLGRRPRHRRIGRPGDPAGSDATGLIPVLRAEDDRGRPLLIAHEDRDDVRSLAVLDVVLNNADRKGADARPLRGPAVCRGPRRDLPHRKPKLRTVLWGWAGEPLTDDDVARLSDSGPPWSHATVRSGVGFRKSRCGVRGGVRCRVPSGVHAGWDLARPPQRKEIAALAGRVDGLLHPPSPAGEPEVAERARGRRCEPRSVVWPRANLASVTLPAIPGHTGPPVVHDTLRQRAGQRPGRDGATMPVCGITRMTRPQPRRHLSTFALPGRALRDAKRA
ncbi:MAG: hypothetical protein IPH03_13785 [Tetrasphaera sp.]|nr:hypothetical protein [Tetrasphaera sp.]